MAKKTKQTKSTKKPACPYAFLRGKGVFIRTVTHHYTGRLVGIYPGELVIEDAAWIADNGRFADAMKTGTLNEVEPFPAGPRIIGRGAVVDAGEWPHALPREQK